MKSAILKIISIILLAYFILSVCSCSEQKKVEKENSMIDLLFQKDSTLLDNSYISLLPKEVIQDVRISDADMNSIKYVIFSASYFGISEVTNTNAAVLITNKDSIQLLKDLFLNNDLVSMCPCGYNYRIQFFDNRQNSIWCEMYYPLNKYSRDDSKIKELVSNLSMQMYKHPTHYIYNIEVDENIYSAMNILKESGFLSYLMDNGFNKGKRSSFQILDHNDMDIVNNKLAKYPFVKRVKKALNSLNIDADDSKYAIVMHSDKPQEISTFAITEQMPQFPGGEKEMHKYIDENLRYPQSALDLGIKGRVIVRFIVAVDGEIIKPRILRGIHPDCDKEVLRIINSMPKWIAGKQEGVVVPVYVTIPVDFKIQEKEKVQ